MTFVNYISLGPQILGEWEAGIRQKQEIGKGTTDRPNCNAKKLGFNRCYAHGTATHHQQQQPHAFNYHHRQNYLLTFDKADGFD